VEEMAKAGQGKIKVGNANVAKNLQVSSPYGITSLPTLILFKGGKALRKVTGGSSTIRLKAMIEEYIQ